MNTKQKLQISNIVNFCFFIFAFIILFNRLYGYSIPLTNSNLVNDLSFVGSTLLIVFFVITIIYVLPILFTGKISIILPIVVENVSISINTFPRKTIYI